MPGFRRARAFADVRNSLGQPEIQTTPEDESAAQDEGPGPDDEPGLDLDPQTFPLDRYKPVLLVGTGSTGVVYLCRDRLLGKNVSVKCLRLVTNEQLIEFQREAKATSILSHQGIISVLDFGAARCGAPYMVMEYVEGVSLKKWIEDRGPLAPELALRVFAQVADALAYAHGKGILHRDITSANVLLMEDGERIITKVIDFGVAAVRQATQEPTVFNGNTIVGTPAYMPPDVVQRMPYTERSEIYGLGCVMFEALAGRPPFNGDTALETISQHVHNPVPALRDVYPELQANEERAGPAERKSLKELTDGVEAVISRCLEKDPELRFASMSELSDGLRELSSDAGQHPHADSSMDVPEVQPFSPARVQEEDRRVRNLTSVFVAAAALVILCVAAFVFHHAGDGSISQKESRAKLDLEGDFIRFDDEGISLSKGTLIVYECASDRALERIVKAIPKKSEVEDVSIREIGSLRGPGLKCLQELPLKHLGLQGHGFGDETLLALPALPLLEGICLEDSENLTGATFGDLRRFPHLAALDCRNCNLSDNCLSEISKIPTLNLVAFIDGGGLSGAGLGKLNEIKSLHQIYFNKAPGLNAKNLVQELPRLKSIYVLHLALIKFNGSIARALADMHTLNDLSLDSTAVNDDELAMILEGNKSLTKLSLGSCPKLTIRSYRALRRARLTDLNLSGNKLTRQELNALLECKTLKKLCLSWCDLTPQETEELLSKLNLSELWFAEKWVNAELLQDLQAKYKNCRITTHIRTDGLLQMESPRP